MDGGQELLLAMKRNAGIYSQQQATGKMPLHLGGTPSQGSSFPFLEISFKKQEKKIIVLKLYLIPIGQGTRVSLSSYLFLMNVTLREMQKELTLTGLQYYDKSIFPGNALKAAEFVLTSALSSCLKTTS